MSDLKRGDIVMLVWACCANGRQHLGWIGEVEDFWNGNGSECFCGYKTNGLHAWINIQIRGVVPVSWISPASPAGPLHDLANFWWPLVYHGTIGTVWWYVVGAYIGARFVRWRARAQRDS